MTDWNGSRLGASLRSTETTLSGNAVQRQGRTYGNKDTGRSLTKSHLAGTSSARFSDCFGQKHRRARTSIVARS